jgi:hypothetical protein
LVNLGEQLSSTSGKVPGLQIQSQLETARTEAANAAHDDAKRWNNLSQDVEAFASALEHGKNASSSQTAAIESDCTPFVPPATPTT